ncbi:MAG: tripartite tricarboxylate transporter substrate binding protein [Sphingomonadaceae bacterium]|nr:tripartite tricarboxylate transporter substrate binding protein [Sphingomonadaceae bacterium]
MKLMRNILGAALLAVVAHSAFAQAWPTQPVRIVVPYPAGGAVDFLARQYAAKLSIELRQTVLVDNRAGAGGLIGADYVAKARPDGYTLVLGTNSSHAIAPSVVKKMPYDPVNDFAPVSLLAVTPYVVVVNPEVPAKTLAELIALAKSKPDTLAFGSAGSGTTPHLAGELFSTMTGVKMRHIPYKGSGPMVNDLLGGQIQLAFDNSAMSQIKAGKLRALSVTGSHRLPSLPDVPTPAEAGLPGYEVLGWFGLYAPKGTPNDIVALLARETRKIMAMPDLVERITGFGLTARPIAQAEFNAFLVSDTAKWANVVKDANVQLE